ncbi:MAG: phage protease [Verrucomicrobiota bacterium JB022]|nr:phage protease [Verrucomicrobiota bacterium JB022]
MNSEHQNTFERYKLVSFGEHGHRKGVQRIDRGAGEALVAAFYSLKGRMARRFGGLPVYVGHPDDAEFSGRAGHDDTRAHGWVQGLEVADDGLFVRIKWARSGRELLAEAHYKYLSPRWLMEPVESGVFRPVRLLSVGLTNAPNIPGEPIANAAPQDEGSVAGVGETQALPPASPDWQCEAEEAQQRIAELEARLARFEVPAANTERRPLKTAALTAQLGQRKPAQSESRQLLEAVNSRMAETGEDFPTAWSALRHRG